MTIAIGILAADGIVIAADTQETIGPTKTQGEKIIVASADRRAIAITGAGTAGYLDSMAQQVRNDFMASRVSDGEVAIRKSFRRFYTKHILTLYPFHHRFPDCDIEAIIGVDTPQRRFVLANQQTAVWECGGFVAVGAGSEQASALLGRTFIPDLPLKRAALLAAYTIYMVKETVEGCGKTTDVYMLRDGGCYRFWQWDQEELDKQFRRYSDAEMVLLHHVLGRAGTPKDILPMIEMTKEAIAKAVEKPRRIKDDPKFKRSRGRKRARPRVR